MTAEKQVPENVKTDKVKTAQEMRNEARGKMEKYGLTKDDIKKIREWKMNEKEDGYAEKIMKANKAWAESNSKSPLAKIVLDINYKETAAKAVSKIKELQKKLKQSEDGIVGNSTSRAWNDVMEKKDADSEKDEASKLLNELSTTLVGEEDKLNSDVEWTSTYGEDVLKWIKPTGLTADGQEKFDSKVSLKNTNSPEYKQFINDTIAGMTEGNTGTFKDPSDGKDIIVTEENGELIAKKWDQTWKKDKWELGTNETDRLAKENEGKEGTDEYRKNMNNWAERAKSGNIGDGIQQLEESLADNTVLQEWDKITRENNGKKEFWNTANGGLWEDIRLSLYSWAENRKTQWMLDDKTGVLNKVSKKGKNIMNNDGKYTELPIKDIILLANANKIPKDDPVIKQAEWILEVYSSPTWGNLSLQEFYDFKKDDLKTARALKPDDKWNIRMAVGFWEQWATYSKNSEIITKKSADGTLLIASATKEGSTFEPADKYVLGLKDGKVTLPTGDTLEVVKNGRIRSVELYPEKASNPTLVIKDGKSEKLPTPV